MAGNNDIAQLMKVVERMQNRMESEKKIEMIATVVQNLSKESQEENGEQPHAKEEKDDRKG